MGWDSNDVYGQPEAFGIVPVFDIDHGADWEFAIFGVWKDAKSEGPTMYYWGEDYGCSCPSPFETFTELSSLSCGTRDEAIEALKVFGGTNEEVADLTDRLYRD